jgi:hypothetical protein
MSGLSSLNFVDGAMRGAQFVAGMQDQQRRAGLMEAQEQRAQESHAAQMANAQQTQEINAIRVRDMNDEHTQKMNKALAWSMHSLQKAPPEYRDFVAKHPNLDASRILSPDYGQAIDTLKGAAEGKIDYRHPDVAKAFDMLNPEIGLGATQGRKVSTSRLYPGKTPGTVMVGLKVDGDPEERPLTERRSSDPDDPVKEVKLEDLIGRLHVAQQYRGFLADPENQQWFIQQTIGEELKNQSNQATLRDLQVKKITKELNEGDPVTYQTDGEGNLMQLPTRSGSAAATPVVDPKGNPVKAPQKTGAGTQATQRQKDFEFAVSKLGMDQEAALEWSSSDKTPTERAEAYANRMVQAETVGGNYPEGYKPNEAWKAHREAFMNEYGNFGKGGKQPKAEAAPKPAVQPRKAPQAAIDELRKNPSMKDKFQEFYGYLPDGM